MFNKIDLHFPLHVDCGFVSVIDERSEEGWESIRYFPITIPALGRVQFSTPADLVALSVDSDISDFSFLKSCDPGKSIKYIEFLYCNINDSDLANISSFIQLVGLNLARTAIRGNGFDDLVRLERLRSIDLSNSGATNEIFKSISCFKYLTNLNLDFTDVSDIGVEKIVSNKDLEILGLDHTNISDRALDSICRLDKLKVLRIGGENISGRGISGLTRLKNLVCLSLGRSSINNSSLIHVGEINSLQTLDLGATKIGRQGIDYIANLGELRSLNLFNTPVSDSDLVPLAGFRSLKKLNIGSTQITDTTIRNLSNIPVLEEIWMEGCRGVTDNIAQCISKMKNIRVICVSGTGISERGIRQICENPSLREIYTTNNISDLTKSQLRLLRPDCVIC